MIVSASYKTDIPAFYGDWFMNRLREGGCRLRNPWNGRLIEVSLDRDSVDGFVFWTRNIRPFLPHLIGLRRQGYPFVVQYTITGYRRALERSVPDARGMVEAAREIAAEHGPHTVVWRYDPILMSTATTPDFHRTNFARLAEGLAGVTDEVVVSFTEFYRKTRRNLDRTARETGIVWRDAEADERGELASELGGIARNHGLRLTACTQPSLAAAAEPARCIDAARLARVAGRTITAPEQGNRPGCLCHRSRDIGAYDSCSHGCAYCYAVADRDAAMRRHRAHDPAAEILGAA